MLHRWIIIYISFYTFEVAAEVEAKGERGERMNFIKAKQIQLDLSLERNIHTQPNSEIGRGTCMQPLINERSR
jgi:hypothetical protein